MMDGQNGQSALFEYPARAALGKGVPKNRLYVASRATRRVRDQMVDKVAQVIWQYKLAPETINLPASSAVPEIQLFTLVLKPAGVAEELPADVLRCIDRAIGFPIIFELMAGREEGAVHDQVRVAAAYKRPSEAEAGKWVVGEYFATDWLPASIPRSPLPVALDLARLYEQILRRLIPLSGREGEPIEDLAARYHQIAVKQRECKRLEARLHKESHFNRKVELNQELRQIKAELDALTC